MIGLRDLAVSQERERLQSFLQEQVQAWEEDLIKDLDERGVRLRGPRKWPRASIWVLDLVDGEVEAGYFAGKGIIPTSEL